MGGCVTFANAFAGEVAHGIINTLSDVCAKIQIVGSLRRNRSSVNDVDLLAIPRFEETSDRSLFGEPVEVSLLDRRLAELSSRGDVVLASDEGNAKRCMIRSHGRVIPVDIAIATEATWWTSLLIRTGSREHNLRLAFRAAGLRMRLKFDGSGLLSSNGRLISVRSEEEIFHHLRLPYRAPSERS